MKNLLPLSLCTVASVYTRYWPPFALIIDPFTSSPPLHPNSSPGYASSVPTLQQDERVTGQEQTCHRTHDLPHAGVQSTCVLALPLAKLLPQFPIGIF